MKILHVLLPVMALAIDFEQRPTEDGIWDQNYGESIRDGRGQHCWTVVVGGLPVSPGETPVLPVEISIPPGISNFGKLRWHYFEKTRNRTLSPAFLRGYQQFIRAIDREFPPIQNVGVEQDRPFPDTIWDTTIWAAPIQQRSLHRYETDTDVAIGGVVIAIPTQPARAHASAKNFGFIRLNLVIRQRSAGCPRLKQALGILISVIDSLYPPSIRVNTIVTTEFDPTMGRDVMYVTDSTGQRHPVFYN